MAMVGATRVAKALMKLSLRNRGMAFIVVDGRVETIRRGPSNRYGIIEIVLQTIQQALKT